MAVGQRTSLEKKVPCAGEDSRDRLRAADREGRLPLWLASDLHGTKPAPSVDVKEGKWTKPVGYTLAGAGLIALGIGIYQGQHSKSLISGAESNYHTNGVYLPADISNLNSASTSATIGNVLLVSGAALLATGGVLAFAF